MPGTLAEQESFRWGVGVRRAWPWLPSAARPAVVWQEPNSETERIVECGQVEILPGGHPRGGAASAPCNVRRRAA